MSHDLEALVDRARAGDRDALAELLKTQESRIYRFGMKMCRHPEDARDVLQETMLAVARGIGDFRGGSSLSTWLYTIARTHCLRRRRRKQAEPVELDSLDDARMVADPSTSPSDAVEDRELAQALESAIASLEDTQREVLVLRDVEGLSASEVAAVLDLSVSAVKSRLHRARLAVRARIAPLAGRELPAAQGSCPNVLELFSKYVEGDISPNACREMEKHLAGCSRCRQECDSLKEMLALCGAPAAEVPRDLQLSVQVALRDFLSEP